MKLNVVELGGSGPGILLLHGLMGRASTWWADAQWLSRYGRVVAYDARGHGHSDAGSTYDRAAVIGDAVSVIEEHGLGPAVVIGHSAGAVTAWQLAGLRPDLVRAIVIEDIGFVLNVREQAWSDWLGSWPVPFASLAQVRAYFGRNGDYFTEVMAERPDGYWPTASTAAVLETLAHFNNRDHLPDLARVACPALVVGGAESEYDLAGMELGAQRLPLGRFIGVPGAGHVVHFDQPEAWRAAVEPFVAEMVDSPQRTPA